MTTETPKQKTRGTAFEVILEPAIRNSPARPISPPKERPLSAEMIERKLREAENRRQSIEAEKLERIARKAQVEAALQKVVEQNVVFAKEAELKQTQRLEAMEENKKQQLQALQDRLRDHAKKVDSVRQSGEEYRFQLKEKIHKKLESSQISRDNQIKGILERLTDHENHVKEVQEASAQFTKQTEEKLITKMEMAMKNRENQLQQLQDKLKQHEKHVKEVQRNKLNLSVTETAS